MMKIMTTLMKMSSMEKKIRLTSTILKMRLKLNLLRLTKRNN